MLIHCNSKEEFQEAIKEGTVVVDFYADWCGPCKMLAPVMERLADEGFKVVKVNVDEQEELAREYSVMSIPAIFIYDDGKNKKQSVGYLPYEAIIPFLKKDN